MYGYHDGSATGTSASRIETLEKFIVRWQTLDWVESRVTVPAGPWHELAGGTYAASHGNSISTVELPSRIQESSSRTWCLEDVGFHVHDFTMDPQQDLLILIEAETYAILSMRPRKWY